MSMTSYIALLVLTHIVCFWLGIKAHKSILRRKKEIEKIEKERRRRLHKLIQREVLLRKVARRRNLKATQQKPDKTDGKLS